VRADRPDRLLFRNQFDSIAARSFAHGHPESTDGISGDASMTTTQDQGSATPLEPVEPPVWQPLPVAEPVDTAAADDQAAGAEPAAAIAPRVGHARVARRANSVTVLLLVSSMIALAGVAFAAGRVTATGQSGTGQTTTGITGINGANGQNGVPNFGPGASGLPNFDLGGGGDGGRDGGPGGLGGTVTGTVASVTSTSITVQLANGQTETVAIGSSTTYHTQSVGTGSDVTQGSTVTIRTAASAGTTTARTATDVTVAK
jgi:hypothetical protein